MKPAKWAIPEYQTHVGLLFLIGLRLAAGREAMARVWLAWGRARYWLLFGLGVVLYFGLQTALNAYFDLGRAPDLSALMRQLGVTGLSADAFLLLAAVQSVLIGPFLGLVIAFGEEYGWRGYLQSELVRLGRVRGIAVLGVIWGLWHAPVILMGHNYPGQPLLGVVLMTLYTTGLAYFLGYAVLKTGSVLLAAYLHALNNQAASYFLAMLNTPKDMAFSFGIGVYGLITLAAVVLLILRDPLWRGEGSNLS